MLAGNPDFQECYDILGAEPLLPEQRIDFIRKAEQLYTFSSIINRTRRRDIGAFTTRKPVTVAVPYTENQQQLHDTVLAMQGSILARIHGDSFINFMMTTIRRQTASCLYGLVPLLKDILNRRLDEAMLDEIETTGEGVVSGDPDRLRGDIEELLAACATLDGHDPKLEALLGIVRTKQQAANNKILLFSSFRHTLAYIEKHLSAEKFRVGLIHGSVPDESRREYLRRFGLSRSDEDALDILLSSEVGCEGLDYQFCDCLVNYDIPWNPMRMNSASAGSTAMDRRARPSPSTT
jgi:SNF2 family DNA or RNA helicase